MTDHTLQKQMIQIGSALCGIAVALGALGSHELKDQLDEASMVTFQTAVRYHFYHAFAILLVGTMLRKLDPKYSRLIYQLFVIGIVVFSGSLYLLATRRIVLGDDHAGSVLWIAGLTPIGGVFFIAGWALLTFKGFKVNTGSGRSHRHNISYLPNSEENDKDLET